MPKQLSMQERMVRFLINRRGEEEVESKSRKYRQFTDKVSNQGGFHFVGRYGAVRVGTCISKSFSITHSIVGFMQNWEKANGLTTFKVPGWDSPPIKQA